MGILSKITNAILGRAPTPSPEQLRQAQRAQQAGQSQPTAQAPQGEQGLGGAILQMAADSTTPAAAPTATAQPVDVEAVLTNISSEKGNPDLNWRTSIVDLMKLLDLDSSLDNRKELATELGYTGEKDGSAEMNIWLHREVMKELERHGGRVPASLSD